MNNSLLFCSFLTVKRDFASKHNLSRTKIAEQAKMPNAEASTCTKYIQPSRRVNSQVSIFIWQAAKNKRFCLI